MKKQALILSTLFITATAFTLIKTVNGYDEIRKNATQNLFIDELNRKNFDQRRTPDTTYVFSKPNNVDAYYSGKYTIRSLVGVGVTSPCYHIANAIDPDGGEYTRTLFDSKFEQLFGVSFHGKSLKMATNSYFLFYNAQGLKIAFEKLYAKPTNSFEKYTYQQIYNLAAKAYARDLAKYFAYIMSKKALFTQVSAQYLQSAKINKNFDTYKESEKAFNKIFPTEASRKQFPNLAEEVDYYDFGSIIRRQCDGTLPTILACLKTVLKDYDPEALKLIRGTF